MFKKGWQNSVSDVSRPLMLLAPMDDVTDSVFRQIIQSCAPPDMAFTEFVNVDGLQSPGRKQLLNKLKFSPKELPLIAQIWGLKPDNFYKTARELVEMGFSGVDINMGCPEKTVVRQGACSALMNNRPLAAEIIQATKEGINNHLPISVKTRIGYHSIDITWPDFLLDQKLDMLTIHGRTRKEMSKVPVHWDIIGHVRVMRDEKHLPTLIIGNGDVSSRSQAIELANTFKLDGIMIGRGVFNDPFIFSDDSPWISMSKKAKLDLYKTHIKLFDKTWENRRPLHTLNKFCKIYVNQFEGAKELRQKLMNVSSINELNSLL